MEEGPHGRRRDLTLCDASGTCVFTLWKYAADIFGEKEGVVLAVKHAAIGSYGGKQALSNWSITGIMVGNAQLGRIAKKIAIENNS